MFVDPDQHLLVKDLEKLGPNVKACFLAGYSIVGDGGEGSLVLVKQHNRLIDSGVVFPSSKSGYVWLRELSDTLKMSFFNTDTSGKTDVTQIVQHAIETAHKFSLSTIHFQDGKYLLGQLDFHPGMEFLGSNNTWLLKKPSSKRFSRMFASKNNQHFSTQDSRTLRFTNLNFDGQSEKCGPYTNYELEHQQLIFLAAHKNSKGRLKTIINNCHFKNGTSDGIHVYHNVEAEIYNCSAKDIFRGGIVVGGGNSTVKVDNYTSYGDKHETGIDIEVDGRGYNDSYWVNIQMENLNLKGDCDIAVREGNFYGRNIRCTKPPYNFATRFGSIIIEDSEFHSSSEHPGRIVIPSSVTFKKCTFIHHSTKLKNDVANIIQWNSQTFKGNKENVTFDNCTFNRMGISNSHSIAIKGLTDVSNRNNLLIFKRSTISDQFSTGIHYNYGGNLSIESSTIESDLPIYLSSNNTNGEFNYRVTINDLHARADVKIKLNYKEHKNNTIIIEDNSVSLSEIKAIKGLSKAKIIRKD